MGTLSPINNTRFMFRLGHISGLSKRTRIRMEHLTLTTIALTYSIPLSQTLMEMALEMSATPMQMMMDSSMKMTTAMGQKQTGTQQISR